MKISRLFIKKLDLSQICDCHSHRLCKMTLDFIFQDLGSFTQSGVEQNLCLVLLHNTPTQGVHGWD